MDYREYTPRPVLAPIVDRLWTLTGEAARLAAADQVILPDGRCELLVHLGEPVAQLRSGIAVPQPRIAFAGQLEGPLVLRPAGRVDVLGVRFHPDGAASLLREPQRVLAGVILPVEAIDAPLGRALDEVRRRADEGGDGIEAMQDVLERLASPSRLDARVRIAVGRVRRTHGRLSIDALASEVGLTRRHLERRFQDVVGVSPKRLARITRFQHARRWLERLDRGERGSRTAASCGYADQAHFIREFRQLSGRTPEAFLETDDALTRFFADDEA